MAAEPDSVVVWNPLAHNRTDIVTVRLETPVGAGAKMTDADGTEIPVLVGTTGAR